MGYQKNNISTNDFEQCIKCTICTVYCPVSAVNPIYPGPKQAGPDGERYRLKKPLFYDDALKYCLNCKRCEVACPSNVKIGDMTERLNDPTAHAEMIAITAATEAMGGKYLSDCTLYVTVEPCPMCAGALAWSQIGKVVYGASDPKRGFSLFSPSLMHPKTEVVAGVLADECGGLVTEFFRKKRR